MSRKLLALCLALELVNLLVLPPHFPVSPVKELSLTFGLSVRDWVRGLLRSRALGYSWESGGLGSACPGFTNNSKVSLLKEWGPRSSCCGAMETNTTSIQEDVGSSSGFTWWVGDLVWLWLWHRLAAVAAIRPLAWEPPYAAGAALKAQDKKKERERERVPWSPNG